MHARILELHMGLARGLREQGPPGTGLARGLAGGVACGSKLGLERLARTGTGTSCGVWTGALQQGGCRTGHSSGSMGMRRNRAESRAKGKPPACMAGSHGAARLCQACD